MQEYKTETQVQKDYQKALRRARGRKVRRWFDRGCNDLLPFDQVFQSLHQQPRSRPAFQDVPLDRIVGSSGRARDFDLAFNPLGASSENRWMRVAEARANGIPLPPVLLYKVGDSYFVEDGNHRVSVARARGETIIRARVIEIDAAILVPEPACTRLGYKLDAAEGVCPAKVRTQIFSEDIR